MPALGKLVEQARQPWSVALLAGWGHDHRDFAERRRFSRNAWTASGAYGVREADYGGSILTCRPDGPLHASRNPWRCVADAGLFAFTRPLSHTVFDEAKYQHVGRFSYSAPAPPGLYDGNVVKTGEPVFRRLISRVNVAFDYRLEAEKAADLSGTLALLPCWQATTGGDRMSSCKVSPAFTGQRHESVACSTCPDPATLDDLEQQTGVKASQYTLAIVPSIAINGTLSGQALRDSFSPQLVFALDEQQLRLVTQPGHDGESPDPFLSGENKSLRKSREAPTTIALLGLSLDVSSTRTLSLIGLALSLLGVGALALATRRGSSGTEEFASDFATALYWLKYAQGSLSVDRSLVEVASMTTWPRSRNETAE